MFQPRKTDVIGETDVISVWIISVHALGQGAVMHNDIKPEWINCW